MKHGTIDRGTLSAEPLGGLFAGDICENRHKGNEASVEAFAVAENVRAWHHSCILGELKSRGSHGMTAKEYVSWLDLMHPRGEGWALNQVSGRFSELAAAGKIVTATSVPRRSGCGIWVLARST